MIIRPARPADRDVVYEICLRTGLAGADATATYADPELLGHVYAGPYLALAPDLAFVLVGPDDQPVGYVLGAADTEAFEAACEARWWPPLRARYPLTSAVDGTPDASLVHRLHEPARADPAVLVEHPAHLHIDLLPVAQGGGHGRRLIEHLLHALRDLGAPGIHLGVGAANLRAVGFYRHLGFRTLEEDEGGALLGLRLADRD